MGTNEVKKIGLTNDEINYISNCLDFNIRILGILSHGTDDLNKYDELKTKIDRLEEIKQKLEIEIIE